MDKLSTSLIMALPAGHDGDTARFEMFMFGQLLQGILLFEYA